VPQLAVYQSPQNYGTEPQERIVKEAYLGDGKANRSTGNPQDSGKKHEKQGSPNSAQKEMQGQGNYFLPKRRSG
jgi:hypothetical protein